MRLNCLLLKERFQHRALVAAFISKTDTLRLVECQERNSEDLQALLEHEPIDLLFITLQQYHRALPLLERHSKPGIICLLNKPEAAEHRNLPGNIIPLQFGEDTGYETFLNALNRGIISLFKSTDAPHAREEQFFFVKSEYRILKVNYDDILFCEGLKDYTRVYTRKKAKPILTLQNLKTFSGRLPSKKFIRVHRSFIISLNHIESISKKDIAIGEKTIPIGNSYRNNLLDLVKHNL